LPIVRFLNELFPIPNFRIFFAKLFCQMVALRNVFFAEWFFAEWQNCGILLRNDPHSSIGVSLTIIIWQTDMGIVMVRDFASRIIITRSWSYTNFWLGKRSFVNASEFCGQASDCAGISEENGWFYTHSKAQVVDSPGVTSWMKGLYWTENFVARASWGAVPSKPGLTGYMDPSKMVGAMGHHTSPYYLPYQSTSKRCFDQSNCKEKMRDLQQEAFDLGMRYA